MALHRLVASAEDYLMAGGHPTIATAQTRGYLPPICTEPYCGGFFWDTPTPALLAPASVIASSRSGGQSQEVSTEQAVEDALKLSRGEATVEDQEADEQARVAAQEAQRRAEQVKLADQKRHLRRLDFPDVLLFPRRGTPADHRVRFGPANADTFDWWNTPNAVQVLVKHRADLRLLLRALGPFLHVQHPVLLEGSVVPKGLRLVAVRPSAGDLRLYPRLGERRALLKDHLPVELTFGGQIGGTPRPNDTPILERKLEWTRPYRVKRLDFVFQPHQTMRDLEPEGLLAAPAGVASGFLEVFTGATGRSRGAGLLRDFLEDSAAFPTASG
uniref:Uncharacterized protein n=1 Tax=Alexandrium catenella TaxID=2925 RepID=A0A7S1R2H2_ALECA|mmetsp:Transcript_43502/g.117324  ORF Transcript_43502/g.117324 Transcript_43502/m.117324 type:complete len:329 (+) Transcript_43502:80-1066(+)